MPVKWKTKGFELNLGYRNSTKFGLKYDINANPLLLPQQNHCLACYGSTNSTFGGNGVESVMRTPQRSTGRL